MTVTPLAARPAQQAMLVVIISTLVGAYSTGTPDVSVPAQRDVFGTSEQRGVSFEICLYEWHAIAITKAISQYRTRSVIHGRPVSGSRHPSAVCVGSRPRTRSHGGQRYGVAIPLDDARVPWQR